MKSSTLHTFTDSDQFTQMATQVIELAIVDAQAERGEAHVAVSGGKSPIPVYQALSQSEKIDWSQLTFWLVDERYVAAEDVESNQRMVRESFGERIDELKAFHTFDTSIQPDEAAKAYESQLRGQNPPVRSSPSVRSSLFDSTGQRSRKDFTERGFAEIGQHQFFFDLVLLGLGEDGHTASLFPGIEELNESERLVLPTWAEGYDTPQRLTMSFLALLRSRQVIFLIQGANKRSIVEKWLGGEAGYVALPAVRFLGHPGVGVFYFGGE